MIIYANKELRCSRTEMEWVYSKIHHNTECNALYLGCSTVFSQGVGHNCYCRLFHGQNTWKSQIKWYT